MAQPPSASTAAAGPGHPRVAWWNDRRFRAVLYQVLVLGGVILLAWYLIGNTLTNLESRNIATGFGFLEREAGFDVSESPIEYSPADTYFKVLVVGVLNTLKVSAIGIVLATLLGIVAGVARLSSNWLVAQFATFYVESLRNIPVLLQLFFWYSLITVGLPTPRQAFNPIQGVFLSNRGFGIPVPDWGGMLNAMIVALLVGGLAAWVVTKWARKRQEKTRPDFSVVSGRTRPDYWPSVSRLVHWRRSYGDGCSGAQGLQFPRWGHSDAGIRGSAYWSRRLHGHLHRRDRSRRHSCRVPWANRGGVWRLACANRW